ncbi:unnamed protein product [Boreogadus saida]
MGKRLEQQPMYPQYTYYYPHYLQTKGVLVVLVVQGVLVVRCELVSWSRMREAVHVCSGSGTHGRLWDRSP